jgi:hypothetical protein
LFQVSAILPEVCSRLRITNLYFALAISLVPLAAYGQDLPTSSQGDSVLAGSTEATLNAAAAACGPGHKWIQVGQSIDITSSVEIPKDCTLWFKPGGAFAGAGKLDVQGEIIAAQGQQIFGPALNVTGLSAATSASGSIPVEWFGAISTRFAGCEASPDSTRSIQAALDAISTAGSVRLRPGCYHTSAALKITKSMVGIKGSAQGFSAPGTSAASVILTTSNSADILDLSGSSDHYLIWNNLEDFAVQRSVKPVGTAAGISVNFAGGLRVDHVQAEDSVRNIYLHGVPDYGVGAWRDVSVGWGYADVSGLTGALYGWYFDSADGVAMNSFKGDHLACSNSLGSGPTTYCYYISGTAVNDINLDSANAAGPSYGIYVNYTGTGTPDSDADIHINMPTLDNCYISCVYIKGLPQTGSSSVIVDAGYMESNTRDAKIVDIEDSYGVAITNNQIFAIESAKGGNVGVYAHNSASLSIQRNKLQSLANGVAIDVVQTFGSAINGNTLLGSDKQRMKVGIRLTNGSAGNAISGNVALGFIETAFLLDKTSAANSLAANACAPSNIGRCISGASKKTRD